MNPLAIRNRSKNFDPRCADLLALAERELSAFFNAVKQVFGSEQARYSAEVWLRELMATQDLPESAREWRSITASVFARLASQMGTASVSAEPQVA